MSIKDLHIGTALTWEDLSFIDQIEDLFEKYPGFTNGVLIGRTGAKLLMLPQYKTKSGALTDLDFVFDSIPDSLKPYLHEEKLIERERRKFKPLIGYVLSTTLSEHTIYKFRTELLPEVDVFEGNIASTLLPSEIPVIERIFYEDGPKFKVAHPGVLVAAILHPEDLSWRLPRGAYIVESFWKGSRYGVTIEGLIEQTALTLSESKVTQSTILPTINRIQQNFARKSPNYLEFALEVRNQLNY